MAGVVLKAPQIGLVSAGDEVLHGGALMPPVAPAGAAVARGLTCTFPGGTENLFSFPCSPLFSALVDPCQLTVSCSIQYQIARHISVFVSMCPRSAVATVKACVRAVLKCKLK